MTPVGSATAGRPSPAPLEGEQLALFTPSPAAAPAWCKVARTGGEALNLRARPGLDQEILGGLLPGEWVQVMMRSIEVPGWVFVKTLDREEGWIAAEFCEEVKR